MRKICKMVSSVVAMALILVLALPSSSYAMIDNEAYTCTVTVK